MDKTTLALAIYNILVYKTQLIIILYIRSYYTLAEDTYNLERLHNNGRFTGVSRFDMICGLWNGGVVVWNGGMVEQWNMLKKNLQLARSQVIILSIIKLLCAVS